MLIRRFIILALLFGYGFIAYGQQQAGVTITYFHNDATGTPVAASDEQGEVIWRKTYPPYGSELDDGGWLAQNNTIGYTGHRLDGDTGLVDMGARLYDLIIGRFLSMDPAPVDPGNLHTFNRYAYANNNPYKYIDPNGEASLLVNAFRRGFGHQDALQISGVSNTTMMVVGAAAGGTTVGAGAVATLGPVIALKEGVQMAFEQATGISVPVPSLRNMSKFVPKGPLWTSTKSKSAVENAFGHWKKHKSEFPEFQNSKQYVEGTKKFLNSPPKGALTKTRSNGDILIFDPKTNTLGVKDAAGAPRTMFRPKDGIDYWNKQ